MIHGPAALRLRPGARVRRTFSVTGDPLPRLVVHGRLLPGLKLVHPGKSQVTLVGSISRVGRKALVFSAANGVTPSARAIFRLTVLKKAPPKKKRPK